MAIIIIILAVGLVLYAVGNGPAKTIAQSINGSQKVATAAPVVIGKTLHTTSVVATKAMTTGAVASKSGLKATQRKIAEAKSSAQSDGLSFMAKVREEMDALKEQHDPEADEVHARRVAGSQAAAS